VDALTKKKADRFRLLNRLYERTDGRKHSSVDMFELGNELGMSHDEADGVVGYLVGEHLVEHRGIGREITITHYGVVEVERALSEPKEPTDYFPPVFNILNVQTMVGSQIQQGTHGSTQTQTTTNNELEAIRTLAKAVQDSLSQLPLQGDAKSEAEAELNTLLAQLQSSKPKTSILRESLKTLRNLIEGVASNAAAAGLLPLFAPLAALLA
jgi:hypothetical protein